MPDRKIIAVVGATGAQGGGLARAILADRSGGFALRAITRTPNSDKAQPPQVMICKPGGRRSGPHHCRNCCGDMASTKIMDSLG